MHIEAVYENGVFKPTTPLTLNDGVKVELTLHEKQPETKRTPYEILCSIANLPLEVERLETAGRDHDNFLYGAES